MKKILILLLMLILGIVSYAKADDILGTWLIKENGKIVEIYKNENGEYTGKIEKNTVNIKSNILLLIAPDVNNSIILFPLDKSYFCLIKCNSLTYFPTSVFPVPLIKRFPSFSIFIQIYQENLSSGNFKLK